MAQNKASGARATNGSASGKNTNSAAQKRKKAQQQALMERILGLFVLGGVCILLFLCNFGLIGDFGNSVSRVMFGIFGTLAYIIPIALFFGVLYGTSGSPEVPRKLWASLFLVIFAGIAVELITQRAVQLDSLNVGEIYQTASEMKSGGGIICGSLAYGLVKSINTIGTIILILFGTLICIVLLADSLLEIDFDRNRDKERHGSDSRAEERAQRRDARDARKTLRREEAEERYEQKREERRQRVSQRYDDEMIREAQRRLQREEAEDEKILRIDKKVRGVTLDTDLSKNESRTVPRSDMHEINVNDLFESDDYDSESEYDLFEPVVSSTMQALEEEPQSEPVRGDLHELTFPTVIPAEPAAEIPSGQSVQETFGENGKKATTKKVQPSVPAGNKPISQYKFPPIDLLRKGKGAGKVNSRTLQETAERLQQTLLTFGVRVTVTDISQGPSVTRYELQPETGVKVSRIVSLQDDIKLNLAASDIRIEAPIPGKAAVGIEVPNKENSVVAFRDLIEGSAFKTASSKVSFAVGKDLAGKDVIADIDKMPHVLIAGATGSGKSVCINTIIMSILYKSSPEEVQMIMIDPKIVELSVYNGIPHLMLPVVTDPKKAAGALQWAVKEMTDRYNKFASLHVREFKAYNAKALEMQKTHTPDESGNVPVTMPRIVIIVDELADLMMVAAGEVETAICRLTQLARAAGIHLVVATQRPSVDVITGLIKANMPSRIAFAVSSGVDSRTILDMNGAEKLLGKGDMLFFPQGYPKPARIQGAFVSDEEVQKVVEFLTNQGIQNDYRVDEKDISSASSSGNSSSGGGDSDDGRDPLFAEAGRVIIDKDKASVGMLQRMLKIGFNRAARIMDQLAEVGVVGPEEGTKPRKILMSEEQFENLLEEL